MIRLIESNFQQHDLVEIGSACFWRRGHLTTARIYSTSLFCCSDTDRHFIIFILFRCEGAFLFVWPIPSWPLAAYTSLSPALTSSESSTRAHRQTGSQAHPSTAEMFLVSRFFDYFCHVNLFIFLRRFFNAGLVHPHSATSFGVYVWVWLRVFALWAISSCCGLI